MSTNINSSYMWNTSMYQQMTGTGTRTVTADFSAMLASVGKTSATEETGTKTLEEYKKDIVARIDAMPVHPSQANAQRSVSIHDNVFQKMMDDPEYEAQILGEIGEGMMADYSIAGPAFVTTRYDADGEFSGTAGGSAHLDKFEKESSDAFWERGSSADAAQEKKDEITRFLDELYERKNAQKKSLLENWAFGQFGEGYGGGANGNIASAYADWFAK